MATTDFVHACGHKGRAQGRNRRDADYQAKRLAAQGCWECRAGAASKSAAEAARENGLPELTGSSKQIAWAETLRQNALAQFEEAAQSVRRDAERTGDPAIVREIEDAVALIEGELRAIAEAKRWIEEFHEWLRLPVRAELLAGEIERRHLAPSLEAHFEARRARRASRNDEAR